jgi:outer membrane protein assembly factor BamB
MSNHLGGVVLVNGYVYASDDPGILKCIEFKTGKVMWKDRSVGKGSVTYADGHIYLRSQDEDGAVALVEATPEEYREKGRLDQPDRSTRNTWPPPVVAGGKLYLRDQDVLLCYELRAKAQ